MKRLEPQRFLLKDTKLLLTDSHLESYRLIVLTTTALLEN